MADGIDGHTLSSIVNLVQNPVVADADPVRLDPVQLLAAWRARYAGQSGQSFDNPVMNAPSPSFRYKQGLCKPARCAEALLTRLL